MAAEDGAIAALQMSAHGTKRTWRDVCPFVRFRGEADIPRCILTIMSDANDPTRTSASSQFRSAAEGFASGSRTAPLHVAPHACCDVVSNGCCDVSALTKPAFNP